MAAEHTLRIGRRIKEKRLEAGLTQRELAEAIPGKADGTQVSKWERGKNRASDDTLEHIARALGCDVAEFHIAESYEPGTPDLMGALRNGESQMDRIEHKLDVLLERTKPGLTDGLFEDRPAPPGASQDEQAG